jgi:hypothetical protein
MKKTVILCLLMVLSISVFSQAVSDTITVKSFFGGCKVYQGGKQLSLSQLGSAVESNELAYAQFKKAQSANIFSMILGGVGGFMMGYQLGGVIAGREANSKMLGIGTGLAVISIPLTNKFVKQIRSTVDIYNGKIKSTSPPTTEFKMGVSAAGLTFAMCF